MISIYTRTHNIFTAEFWKWLLKKITRTYTGPDAVFDSLIRGLKESGVPFEINPLRPKYKIIHVISGACILSKMIRMKEQGKIEKLVVGPNVITTPHDKAGIIQNPSIDIILMPSQWTKDFFVSIVPNLAPKIKIWPAGVQTPEQVSKKDGLTIVYKKNIPEEDFVAILKILDARQERYEIFEYGKYNKKRYDTNLQKASLLIYLQKTESQGLALQEAWSFDVPTLVWENSLWQYSTYTWSDNKISAPYLTDKAGLLFNVQNLNHLLDEIKNKKYVFAPREYCINNLSDKISVGIYIDIIKA